jgi:hypothetical protein
MIKQVKRAALYVRVSTDHQTVENQIRELIIARLPSDAAGKWSRIGCAWRARRFVAAVVFAGVFLMGTGLTVYTSVGRQARVTETAEAKAQAVAD